MNDHVATKVELTGLRFPVLKPKDYEYLSVRLKHTMMDFLGTAASDREMWDAVARRAVAEIAKMAGGRERPLKGGVD